MSPDKKISFFKRKQPEAEWQKDIDRFHLSIAPKWFQFIEWILATGALGYISNLTNNRLTKILYGASFIVLYNFTQTWVMTFPYLKYMPGTRNKRLMNAMSYIIAAVISAFSYLVVWNVLEDLKRFH